MSKLTITLPDELASLVLERQRKHGYPTPDEAAAALISEGLVASSDDEDHSAGLSDEELRALIDEAEATPLEPTDGASLRAEVLRRYAKRTRV